MNLHQQNKSVRPARREGIILLLCVTLLACVRFAVPSSGATNSRVHSSVESPSSASHPTDSHRFAVTGAPRTQATRPGLPAPTPHLVGVLLPAFATPKTTTGLISVLPTPLTVLPPSTATPTPPAAVHPTETLRVRSPLPTPMATPVITPAIAAQPAADLLIELLNSIVLTSTHGSTIPVTTTQPISETDAITLFMPVIAVANTASLSVPISATTPITPILRVADVLARARAAESTDAITLTAMPNVSILDGITETRPLTNSAIHASTTPVVVVPVAPTPDGTARTVRVPILMYHYLSDPPNGADIYRRDLSVSPQLFAEHLDAMLAEGYTAISLYALFDHLMRGAELPAKPVIITFDDGYRDNYEYAFPLLVSRGMTATFFVVSDFIDAELPDYIAWDMVREMYAAGMSIESHGRNHVSLRGRSHDFLVWQALGSLETIEYELGVRPRFVSYPAGEYDQATIDIFRSANYWAGLTTKQGATHSSDHLFELHRVRMRNTTQPDELLRLLALDW